MKKLLYLMMCIITAATNVSAASSLDLARELAEEGRIADAYNELEKVISSTTDIGAQHRAISAMVQIAKGSDVAITLFLNSADRVVQNLDGDNKAYLQFHIGKRMMMLGQFETSTQFLESTLAENVFPESSRWPWDMRYQIGYNYYMQDDFEKALEVFSSLESTDALTKDQMYAVKLQAKASAFKLEDWSELVERAELLLVDQEELGYQDAQLRTLSQLGKAYSQLGDSASAIRVYREYLALQDTVYSNLTGVNALKRETITSLLAQLERHETRLKDEIDDVIQDGFSENFAIEEVPKVRVTDSPEAIAQISFESTKTSDPKIMSIMPLAMVILVLVVVVAVFVALWHRKES